MMSPKGINAPRYHKGYEVSFLGGSGTIKNHQFESGCWIYAVEMQLGPEPAIGRIGHETTILLPESELALTASGAMADLIAA
jgi:hypothetical protein